MEKNNDLKDIFLLGQIIGDKNRLKIISLLKGQEVNATQIHKTLRLPQNSTSHHLQILLKNEVIKVKRLGRFYYYSLNTPEIKRLASKLKNLF